MLLNIIIAACTFPYRIIYDPSYAFMRLTIHMHAIGATEEITLVELDDDPQEENQEISTRRFLEKASLRLITFLSAPIISLQLL